MGAVTGQLWRRTPSAARALLSIGAVSTLGGIAAALWSGEPLIGAAAYYALALMGVASPEGAVLRDALTVAPRAAASARQGAQAVDQ